ncbi:HAD domain-containing protein [Dioscorea alata]|uniref:HAD domain-containing protein n=1 Tax=Dioscorea alata TaxID=55571 RepID=A0ACB7W194_DIOAL|nr:HAD domain-containing protein [Dioscorea alata]
MKIYLFGILNCDLNLVQVGDWNSLWRLKLPPKIHYFIWRLQWRCLPLRGQLMEKGMYIQNICSCCNRATETRSHLFLHCPFVASFWSHMNIDVVGVEENKFNDWFVDVLKKYPDNVTSQACLLLWSVWKFRNTNVWNKYQLLLVSVFQHGLKFLMSWREAQVKVVTHSNATATHLRQSHKWVPSSDGWLKCNLDGALFAQQVKYGMRVVLRYHVGHFIAGFSVAFNGHYSSTEVEAIALKEVLS